MTGGAVPPAARGHVHLLIVYAHPRAQCYTRAVATALAHGAEAAGHSHELADLYREGFDPCLREPDYAQFQGLAMPEDIRREQARVERADGLGFVFPIWWWSFPAILKGWIDRVFSEGWAYRFDPALSRGILRDRPTLLLGVGASRASTAHKYGYDEAMQTQILTGMLGYCGLRNVETHLIYDVEASPQARAGYLARVEACGRELFSPPRLARNASVPSDRPA